MIRVQRPDAAHALKGATRAALARRQTAARALPPGDPRIGRAWANFLQSKPRQNVAEALDRCFRFKCAYCEGIAAQDIEHFFPKTAYPDRMFEWTNFLRGCKNCNNFKRDQFPLDRGLPVLLDPCQDDPLDYFVWDFQTGATGVRPEPAYRARAARTRELFRLDQEPLREERRKKLLCVLYLLARVLAEDPVTRETKERLKDELGASRPWLGIVRQLLKRPGRKYRGLVKACRARLPEIDTWVRDWL